jgi:16S rRNA C967 or C1407 C5-methylase (RsmB/RsmF family)
MKAEIGRRDAGRRDGRIARDAALVDAPCPSSGFSGQLSV